MVALPQPVASRVVDVLALVDDEAAQVLKRGLPGLEFQTSTDAEEYVSQLSELRARIAVVGCPPATSSVIERAATIRRRRPALRCVLVNDRADVAERLHALDLG